MAAVPTKKLYASIPDPGADVGSLLATVSALKSTIETLVGINGQPGTAATVFVQPDMPAVGQAKNNDIWFKKPILATDVWVQSVWDDKSQKWLKVG